MARLFAASLLALSLSGPAVAADEEWPHAGQAVRAAAETLAKAHVAQLPLDDAMSRRWFDAFFVALDPQRMYFLESDIRRFKPLAERLDDLTRRESVKFPLLVGRRFQERVVRAGVFAEEFVVAEHDFTVDENVPRTYAEFAANEAELRERWRKRLKLQFLIEKAKGANIADTRSDFTRRYRNIIRHNRDLSSVRLCGIYLNVLASLYDRNSGYLTPRDIESFSS
jgi:carboxyl-terminal processing protease